MRAFYTWTSGTHLPVRHHGGHDHGCDQEVPTATSFPHGPSTHLGGNLIAGNPKKCEFLLWSLITPPLPGPHPSDTETRRDFCCNVFIMCQKKKLHHSLLHTSAGECSLACIYYNEVETSHTASQNPQSSWDMQQCNVSSAGRGV